MLKIFSFNVNGLQSFENYVKQNFNLTLNDYIKEILQADILCIQETKGSKTTLNKYIVMKDYKTFFSYNKIRNGHSGVCLIISKKLHLKGITTKIESMSFHSDEGRIIQADFGTFKLLNLYFPFFDDSNENIIKEEKMKMFYKNIKEYIQNQTNLIVVGDFNAVYLLQDHYQFKKEFLRIKKAIENENDGKYNAKQDLFKNNQPFIEKKYTSQTELPYYFRTIEDLEEYFFQKFQRKWLFDFVNKNIYIDVYDYFCKANHKYTCWNSMLNLRPDNLGTRIDYIFVPETMIQKVIDVDINNHIFGSDHCPLYIIIDINPCKDGFNLMEQRKGILHFVAAKK